MQRIETSRTEVILGEVEITASNRIEGWVLLESRPTERLTIRCTTPRGAVVSCIADSPRPELVSAGLGDGLSGFELCLPDPISYETGTIDVWVEAHDVALTGSTAGSREIAAPVFALQPGQCHEAIGVIDEAGAGIIEGWLYSPDPSAVPVVKIGGRFAQPVELKTHRPDVCIALGVSGDLGFRFKVSQLKPDDTIELHVLTARGQRLVTTRVAGTAKLEENFFAQLSRAAEIARQTDAVAIVCWDGSHNPVGRAKVLYDVASTNRPAVIITYLSEGFGGKVWQPLESLDIPIVTIPWSRRAVYHRALKRAGIQFDTVWICKARYPSFVLAKAVASPNARLILDYDDNEEHFSRSPGSKDRPYGLSTINLAGLLAERVPARTAASVTLQRKFGAGLVRHARREQAATARSATGPYRVAFVGTVRAHKNALTAARAIRLFALTTGYNVEFHVYGDFNPPALANELVENGAIVMEGMPMSELYQSLSQMDVILTGFPGDSETEVIEFQISSKIGDALSVGKPALVPNGPSVSDLAGMPGVFLFDESSFAPALKAALDSNQAFSLPNEFTLHGAYKEFAAAEVRAAETPPALQALAPLSAQDEHADDNEDALLLIWKQPDAGLYGRRVDQVARAYKKANPGSQVIILEFVHRTTLDAYERNSQSFSLDHARLLELSNLKQAGRLQEDGVELRQIVYASSAKLGQELDDFLLENGLLPTNTSIVCFPLINFFEKMLSTLSNYSLIVDVVDNHFSWPGSDPVRTKMLQYVSLFGNADAVVFNSTDNQQYFREKGILPADVESRMIPNWYATPADADVTREITLSGLNVLYSGNMNDRVDWPLLRKIADLRNDVTLHLAGAANLTGSGLLSLLELPNVIYHGPLSERQTLELLRRVDVAVMPHEVDEVSRFMNPLKVHMYASLGVPTVATNVPGIIETPWLQVARDHAHFLRLVKKSALNTPPARLLDVQPRAAREYLQLIDAIKSERPDSEGRHEKAERREGRSVTQRC